MATLRNIVREASTRFDSRPLYRASIEAQKEIEMSKRKQEKKQETPTMDPKALRIIGGATLDEGERGERDTSHVRGENYLWQADVLTPLDVSCPGLLDSIRIDGVRIPVIVRLDNDGGYTVVDGRTRVRAARLAGLASIPVSVEVSHDGGVTTSVVANLLRKPTTPRALMEAVMAGLTRGDSQRRIAELVGRHETLISQYASFLAAAIPQLREDVGDGVVTFEAGALLATLPAEEQEAALTKAKASVAATGGKKVGKKAVAVSPQKPGKKARMALLSLLEASGEVRAAEVLRYVEAGELRDGWLVELLASSDPSAESSSEVTEPEGPVEEPVFVEEFVVFTDKEEGAQ